MKKLLLLSALTCCLTIQSFAVLHTVVVKDFSFTPATLTAHPGDTIQWTWQSGTHTTTSTTIPSGAAAWDNPMTSSSTTFNYVVPNVVGTYNYKCTPHASMGMTGSFTVVSNVGITPVTAAPVSFSIAPNPASGYVHIQLVGPASHFSVKVIDLLGREVVSKDFDIATDAELDLQAIPKGNYVVCVQQDGKLSTKVLTVTN